eukprot:TRINITY_DN19945_c0_g1_i1.p1 TRINITY_DN19945_c0_g1~~TRINITY_DN19945_c0_g1_i1.p1  ORF type:complete len:532 (+),score=166.59 TRINITY_DN19945_c0_g1_i1:51-1598(+)
MALRRTLRRMARDVVDWGRDDAEMQYKRDMNAKRAKRTFNSPLDESKRNWLTSPAEPKDLATALDNIDLTSGPAGLINILKSPSHPHPLDLFRAIKAKHSKSKINDKALGILLMHCKDLIIRGERHQYNKAKTLFHEALVGRHDVGASTNTALIMCACAAGKPDDAERTMSTMKNMEMVIPPNAYTALISAHSKTAGGLDKAWATFEDMATNAKFDKQDRTAVATTLAMAAASLLHGAAKAKSGEDADKVWKLVVGKWKTEPNVFMYSNYISALVAAGQNDDAFRVFEEMKDAGVAPTHHTYTALLMALGNDPDDIPQAEELVTEMQENNLIPNIIVYTALMNVYKKANDVIGMKAVYRRLRKAQLVPTDHTWGVIVAGCDKLSRHPDDDYARLVSSVWEKAKHGLMATGQHRQSAKPGLPSQQIRLALHILNIAAAQYNSTLVTDVVNHLHKQGSLFTKVAYDPCIKALKAVNAAELAEKYEAESKKKIDEYNARLLQSTRPKDAAERAKLAAQ